jgi:hypothetical protein
MNRTTLAEKERSLARRKAALGIEGSRYVAVNPGRRRAAPKRRLLRTIEQEARARGRVPPFQAAIG